jgi:signal transduction histidine kinase
VDFLSRTRWVWHALFGSVVAIAGLFLVADGHPGGLALLAVLGVAYAAAFGWPATRRPDRWPACAAGLAYLAVAYAVVAVLAWADPNTLVLLFVLFPQTFLAVELRPAIALSVVLSALYTLVLLARDGWSARALRVEGIGGVATAVFAIAIGAFITGLVRQNEQRRMLIADLTTAQSERDTAQRAADVAAERERLAREIHDTLAQGFTSIVMLGQAAQASLVGEDPAGVLHRLEQVELVARDGLAEARALVAAMQPAALDGQPLDRALSHLVERFTAEAGVPARFEVTGESRGPHSASEDVVLLRVAQEALANVRRHAAASEVTVRLVVDPGATTLEVDDDGRGFDASRPSPGFGLAGMRARAEEVGGLVEVDSCAGRTTVRVRLGTPTGAP